MTGGKWSGDLAAELMGKTIASDYKEGKDYFSDYISFRHYQLCFLFELGKPANIIH